MWTLLASSGNRAVWAEECRDGSGYVLSNEICGDGVWMGEASTLDEARIIAQELMMDTDRYDRFVD